MLIEKIYAPLKGGVLSLSQVSDPVFASEVMGDGFAIMPTDGISIHLLQEQ